MSSFKSLMMKFSLFMLVATLIWICSNYHVMAVANTTDDEAAESNIWCVANRNTTDETLIDIIEWTCGQSGIDCSPIQQGGSCYEQNTTLYRKASFIMNRYYQVNPSCYFSGHGVNATYDPSCGDCSFDSKFVKKADEYIKNCSSFLLAENDLPSPSPSKKSSTTTETNCSDTEGHLHCTSKTVSKSTLDEFSSGFSVKFNGYAIIWAMVVLILTCSI